MPMFHADGDDDELNDHPIGQVNAKPRPPRRFALYRSHAKKRRARPAASGCTRSRGRSRPHFAPKKLSATPHADTARSAPEGASLRPSLPARAPSLGLAPLARTPDHWAAPPSTLPAVATAASVRVNDQRGPGACASGSFHFPMSLLVLCHFGFRHAVPTWQGIFGGAHPGCTLKFVPCTARW